MAPADHPDAAAPATGLAPQAIHVPRVRAVFAGHRDAATTCTLPDGTPVNYFHCCTPQQIRAAYGVNKVPQVSGAPNYALVR